MPASRSLIHGSRRAGGRGPRPNAMRPAASAPISSGGLGFWRRFGAGLLLLPACLSGMAMAAEDLPGARDPEGIPRFPRAWVVAFSEQSGFAPQEFVISAVEKIRRELRIEQKLRIEAKALGVTYRIPSGTPRAEVIEHYRRLLGPDALFSCEERDCGRSNGWANNVFGEALLYGPDGNQFYNRRRIGRAAGRHLCHRAGQPPHLRPCASPAAPVGSAWQAQPQADRGFGRGRLRRHRRSAPRAAMALCLGKACRSCGNSPPA